MYFAELKNFDRNLVVEKAGQCIWEFTKFAVCSNRKDVLLTFPISLTNPGQQSASSTQIGKFFHHDARDGSHVPQISTGAEPYGPYNIVI